MTQRTSGWRVVVSFTLVTAFSALVLFIMGCPAPPVGNGNGSTGEPPTLQGLDANKSVVLPFGVQAAYNDDTMFFHMNWEGDRGDTHD
ncbi:MAG: hypothetical protein IIB61_03560, partial [Planctomycetes bacterium]|nr:hypothetical protein [Planctomycetota bacterium]